MEEKRLKSIQILRAIAFIAIFLSHAEVANSGMFGVLVFLLISGFCMVYAYLDKINSDFSISIKNNLSFAVNKIKRLYPLHILALLVIAGIKGWELLEKGFPHKETLEYLFYFATNALLLQSLIPWRDGYFSFNAVSWYLSMIFICYLFVPFIMNKLRKMDRKAVSFLAMLTIAIQCIVSVILQIAHIYFGISNDILKWVTYICPFYRILDIVIGAIYGWYFVKMGFKRKIKKSVFCILCVVLFGGLITQLWIYNNFEIPRSFVYDLYWLTLCFCFLVTFVSGEKIIYSRKFYIKTLVYIGNISGYAFLIHQIVIKAVEKVVNNRLVLTVSAFGLTIICTELYMNFAKLIRDIFKRRKDLI